MFSEFKTFVAVAREGTFTGAGRALGLTQSAVSAQMKRLEAFIGMPLFERGAKSAVLNAQGRDVLEQAREVIAQVDRMRAANHPGIVTGTLRIGAIASVQQHGLVYAMQAFQATYPAVRVRVVPGVSLALLGQVDAGELDLAVMIRPPFVLPPELLWQPIFSEPMALAVPQSYVGDDWRRAMTDQRFIRYERASFGGRAVDLFLRKQKVAVNEFLELDEIDAMVNMVRAGLGVALIPVSEQLDRSGIRLIELASHGFWREIGIVLRAPVAAESLAGMMTRCFLNAVGDEPARTARSVLG